MGRGPACGRKLVTPGSSARSRVTGRRRWAISLAAFALWLLGPGTADAQFPFWPQQGFWPGFYAPHRHRHSHHASPGPAKDVRPEALPKGTLQLIVSIPDQQVSLYENDALIARSSVSTGVRLHPTPVGIFSVIGKQRWHRSNIYSGAPMPYMQRITWSGIALHAGVVPGHPASHGCIRLTNDFAIRLWHLTRRGTRVIIAPEDVRPVEIASPRLFKRKVVSASSEPPPTADPGGAAGTVEVADGSPASGAAAPETAGIPDSGAASAPAVPAKIVPVSVFISRSSGKLFVRRGFAPLFDVPVKIQNPEEPIGTHVFTAVESADSGTDLRWIVVSMPPQMPRTIARPARRHDKPERPMVEISVPPPTPRTAGAALERIEIPPDAIERISELLTPASSLIVSDGGFSRETGRDTDFIVVMH